MESDKRSALASVSAVIAVLLSLEGCPTPLRPTGQAGLPASTAVGVAPTAPGSVQATGHEGQPYDVDSRESLLTILAFRGGALAKAGHNHVIASHDLTGTFYVPGDALRCNFELHMPVGSLAIDEADLRAREGPEFPKDVPDSAKEGTRRNMLSEALLNGSEFPEITLTAQRLTAGTPGSMGAIGGSVQAEVRMTVRGQAHTITVPVSYTLADGMLVASGDLPIKQSDLGLTPFSAMLGALQVQDEMRVRFRIVARQAQTRGAGGTGGAGGAEGGSSLFASQQQESAVR